MTLKSSRSTNRTASESPASKASAHASHEGGAVEQAGEHVAFRLVAETAFQLRSNGEGPAEIGDGHGQTNRPQHDQDQACEGDQRQVGDQAVAPLPEQQNRGQHAREAEADDPKLGERLTLTGAEADSPSRRMHSGRTPDDVADGPGDVLPGPADVGVVDGRVQIPQVAEQEAGQADVEQLDRTGPLRCQEHAHQQDAHRAAEDRIGDGDQRVRRVEAGRPNSRRLDQEDPGEQAHAQRPDDGVEERFPAGAEPAGPGQRGQADDEGGIAREVHRVGYRSRAAGRTLDGKRGREQVPQAEQQNPDGEAIPGSGVDGPDSVSPQSRGRRTDDRGERRSPRPQDAPIDREQTDDREQPKQEVRLPAPVWRERAPDQPYQSKAHRVRRYPIRHRSPPSRRWREPSRTRE